jgi:hypothetical protein
MKKRIFITVAAFVLIASGYLIGKVQTNVVHAQTRTSISKGYGKCVGVYTRGNYVVLVFEDSSGIVRMVNASDGSLVGEDSRD